VAIRALRTQSGSRAIHGVTHDQEKAERLLREDTTPETRKAPFGDFTKYCSVAEAIDNLLLLSITSLMYCKYLVAFELRRFKTLIWLYLRYDL
jgi:hypothetical protein